MKNNKGFTLLEILLVVAAIAILAGIVIVAINPGKQLGDTRNAQRNSDVNAILNAIYQYSIDNDGVLPFAYASSTDTEICTNSSSTVCTDAGLIDLSKLIVNERYLIAIPNDPNGVCVTDGGCYTVATTTEDRVVVKAPDAEQGSVIEVKK